ncbi:hypothetical protein BN1317_30250 [Staphylococcus capitis]|mgnify:FL=1|uniref:hypothetical protein n=1 Tax=Staphylococcus capitis TaxID=29388 RepID=UPI0005DFACC1|nr:hypothetical protein [Staphylococcus capitis]CQD26524.1 hypothetical protein SCAPIOD120071 [Staphylococcus capitis]CQD31090.1 hypothetical protein SCAPIOD150003 [Staphylococcus capitis]CUT96041.1 hypothetical protein BN1317_30250 [Staphylococcus capitis]
MINKNDHITLKLFDDINFEILKKFRVRYFTSYTKFVPLLLQVLNTITMRISNQSLKRVKFNQSHSSKYKKLIYYD